MGAWGVGILDDDGACDIVGEYKIFLAYGIANEEAYEIIRQRFYEEFVEADLEDIYWLSIAIFQWQKGVLMESVRNKALTYIDNSEYLEVWKESGEKVYQNRKRVLEDLKQKLMGPPNKLKKVSKPPMAYRRKTSYETGDLLAFKMCSDYTEDKYNFLYNKYILMRVISIGTRPISQIKPDLDYRSFPCVGLYNWYGAELPDISSVRELEFIPFVSYLTKNAYGYTSLYQLRLDKEIMVIDKDASFLTKTPVLYTGDNVKEAVAYIEYLELSIGNTFMVLEGKVKPERLLD